MKVAIQGERGAFSHQTALQLVPRGTIFPCQTSADIFDAVDSGRADCAVIPVENTLAGPVAEHLDLLGGTRRFCSPRVAASHRAQPDRRPGDEAEGHPAGAFPSCGFGPVPQFFPQSARDSSPPRRIGALASGRARFAKPDQFYCLSCRADSGSLAFTPHREFGTHEMYPCSWRITFLNRQIDLLYPLQKHRTSVRLPVRQSQGKFSLLIGG